ncbi:hypothetical protein L907_11595 [Agrobacterium sp. C13]|nr:MULTISPECIES: hypothetical protein [unclassified Agrobacterium]KVK41709.1 hypothetical protein L903_11650 [Agrobacterium sp. JL28]KVK56459.1 hypothetical protein L906_11615 [Agrobacterium sp. TS45]KVK58588.1 hypothetical protein L907_11595 [Agrobacterium sp. C13]
MAGNIQYTASDGKMCSIRTILATAAAREIIQSQHEFLRLERFENEIVSSDLESGQPIFAGVATGHHNDRYHRSGSQHTYQYQSVFIRKSKINDDGHPARGGQILQPIARGGNADRHIACRAKIGGEQH